ncbi:hypothetical protein PG984_012929 [Apiospora sp. TS-2023a]
MRRRGLCRSPTSPMNLATASDVLRAVIFGKDRKSVADDNTTMDIGEVDIKAMSPLRITYFDFGKVPLGSLT